MSGFYIKNLTHASSSSFTSCSVGLVGKDMVLGRLYCGECESLGIRPNEP